MPVDREIEETMQVIEYFVSSDVKKVLINDTHKLIFYKTDRYFYTRGLSAVREQKSKDAFSKFLTGSLNFIKIAKG